MNVVAVIPARGGSKSIPRKNIALIGGKPLIAWRIERALACKSIQRVLVSTDDEEIAAVARQYKAEVPFLRPASLAEDETPGVAPIVHAARWLAENSSSPPEYIMMLQPTSPFCSTEDLQSAINLAIEKNAEAVVSVSPVEQHPYWMKRITEEGTLEDFFQDGPARYPRRQDLPPLYALNGAIYLTRVDVLMEKHSFYGDPTFACVMPPERSLDIDTPGDLELARLIMEHRDDPDR